MTSTTKQELATAICSFLQESIKDNTISSENQEGMEVAIDCIKEAFAIQDQKSNANLYQIFEVYTNTIKKQKAKAAQATIQVVQPPKQGSDQDKIASEELKSQGNKLLGAKNFEEAIVKYTEAIELYESAVYYSNRAAAYSQCGRHESAAADAKRALELDPGFTKAFSRLGHAEFCLGNFEDAVQAYKNGLQKEPNNASLKQSLAAAEQKLNAMSISTPAARESGGNPFASMGGGAGGMPDFGAMMSDPSFMAMAQNMMSNPALAGMMNNPALRNMMGGGGGMPDMAAMMNNPEIAQMAQGLMSDPNAMASLMNNPDLKNMAEKYAPK